MKKSSLIKKITLALALLLGVGGVFTGLSLKDRPIRRAEAGTGPTYTISQKQADEASGNGYGIFSWWGGAYWETYGSGYNCKVSHAGTFMSAYHANLVYATKITLKINFVSCTDGTTNPKVYLQIYSNKSSKKTLSVGNNTVTWNLPKDIAADDYIEFCFDYPNAGSSGSNWLYFNGHDATTPIVTIETNEAGRNVSINTTTGVKSVYLSTSSTATSGSASGTKFNDGATVYGFAELAAGYKHPSGWTKVSGTEDTEGAKYRVGSITVSSSATSISYTAPTIKTKKIARNGNGASSGSDVTLTYGQAATVSALSRTGYSFTGWNTNANGTGTSYTTSLTTAQVNSLVLGSVSTFYAQWSANKNTVTLNKNGGTGGSNSVTATYDSAMPSASMPTRTGYTFNGYFDSTTGGTKYYNANGSSAKKWNKTSNTTLYAQWTPISKDITLKANGATGSDQVVTITYDSAKSLTPGYSKTGYYLMSWNTNSSGTGYSCNANLSKNDVNEMILASYDTLYAQWAPESYAINYKDQNGASFSGTHEEGYPQTHTYDSETSLKGAIRSGYNFNGWFLDSPCEGSAVTTLGATEFTSSITLYAKWTFKEEVQDVIDLIDAIGEVVYTPECKALIDAARDAYEALDDYDKPAVSNYSTLTDAEAEYIAIRDAGIADVEDDIKAIGTVEYTYESRDLIRTARSNYEALTDEQKGLLDPEVYALLTAAEAKFIELKDAAVSNVIDLINAIGKVKYNETSKAKIDAARNAFDNSLLDEEQESFDADIYEVLTDAEELYEFLMNNAKAAEVRDLINAIGEVEYTPESKALIDTARAAFDALTEEQQALVGNIKTLKEAEATYAHLEDNHNAAKAVDDLIDAIGEVVYKEESKDKIDAAREAYEALTDEQKPLVTKLEVLEAAEARWEKLVEDNAAADAVDELIDAIGEVEFTPESKALIDTAREAYEALTDDQKPLVDKLGVLEAAEEAWQKLVDDHAAADAVDALIDAIGEVEYTPESKALIDAARDGYDALTDDQKPLVENLDVLEAAEEAWQKLVDDHAAADAVDALIDAIGEVEYTPESKAKIDAAREAYDALTDDQKPLVDNLDVLEAAEEAWQKLVDDHKAADEATDLIGNIGKVTYTDESKELIDAAREAYDALTDDQKALIDDEVYEELTDAEELYKLYDDNAKAEEVRDLIDAIGTVEYTDESKTKIDEAREAFDALTEDQQALVGNIETLLEAEDRYEFLKENHEIAEEVDNLISAIGEVEYTEECKEAIDEAREAYDALTDDQKELVTKYQTLLDAEAAWQKLVDDHAAADTVEELIDAIGEVEYTPESKALIDEAREGYDALTDDQKALVENYQDLVDAEEAYAKLKEDHEEADAVEALIDAIGEVEYTDECKGKIDDAREAYEALSEEGKELVNPTKLETLEDAEEAYKVLDDQAKAAAVKDLIDAIGEVEYTEESKEAIDDARDAYDALTEDQKALIDEDTLKVLTDAEALYAKLEADHEAAEAVEDLIDAIGEVEYTEECKEAIDDAREAYDALTDEQKALIDEDTLKVLTDAEAAYEKLVNDHAAAEAVEDLIDAIGEVEYTEECKDAIDEAREAYDALTDDQKPLVSEEALDALEEAEEAYKALDDQAHADAVEDLIDAIGIVEYTEESKALIDEAREAYDDLTEDQQALVENYQDLLDAEAAWQKLVDDHAAAEAVEELIDAIGEVEYTEECKGKIDDAREVYDALTDDQKPLVSEEALEALEEAEEAYAKLDDDHKKADAVKDLINAIGEVEYTDECKGKIDAAREGYEALTEDQKALIEDNILKVLTDAEEAYKALDDQAHADAVKDLIDAIGEVEFTEESKEAIDDARDAYDALTEDQKALVDNYQTLLDAEAAWQKLVDDHAAAEEVEDLIEAIGEVEFTEESKALIDDAREGYDALTEDQKPLVSNYQDLLDAEAAWQKLVDDHAAADAVEDLIDAIGEVEYTEECKGKIDDAREAYDALTDDQKPLVSEEALDTLEAAEEAYAKLEADHEAAEAVEDLIDAIGEVEFTEESKALIDDAREGYDALTEDQKPLVNNYQDLLDAEAAWQKLVDDHAAADAVDELIDAIGEVEFTEESKALIDAAREAYDALTDDQKPLVDKLGVLEAAEAAWQKLVDDHAAADAVEELIDEIGEVEYTEECKDAIDEAREAYEALTDDQKPLVSEEALDTLEEAEEEYAKLKADHEAAEAVEDLIDAIGEVEFTDESKGKIDDAREAYDALTDDQKPLVENLDVLEAAEEAWQKLVDDHAAAEVVEELIDEIGEVEYTEECKEAIDDAREAYEALTDDQKPLVSEEALEALEDAEEAYAKLDDDHKKAEAVENLIAQIGEVEYTAECLERIQNASEAYVNLTDDQKALVDPNLVDLLDDDIAEYNKLEEDHQKADAVIDLIEAIGEVEYTEECKNAIEDARNAYNLLTEEQKALVGDKFLSVLEAAEEAYEKLVNDHQAAEAVEDLIDMIGEVEYTEECKVKIAVALTAYEELTSEQKAFVSVSKLGALEDAIEEYNKLEEDHNKANETVTLIERIGTVTFSNESLQKIQNARRSYRALSSDQKALVSEAELAKLVAAERRYAELEEAAGREVIVDDSSKVKVETNDGTGFPEDINLKVEVKTSISAQEGSAEYDVVKGFLAGNEYIAHVYDVKLIQTMGGLEREIQPSDIKPGMRINVHITLPSDIDVKNIKVIHIHSADDVELIKDFSVVDGEIVFTVNRLSEFAFVSQSGPLPGWALALIIVAECLIVLIVFYFLSFLLINKWIKKDGKAVRAIKLGKKKDGQVRLIVLPCKITYRDANEVFDTKSKVK